MAARFSSATLPGTRSFKDLLLILLEFDDKIFLIWGVGWGGQANAGGLTNEVCRWWGLLIITKSWGWGLLNFLWSQMPSWTGSCKRPGYQFVTSCITREIGNQGCHCFLCGYFLYKSCARWQLRKTLQDIYFYGNSKHVSCAKSFYNHVIHVFSRFLKEEGEISIQKDFGHRFFHIHNSWKVKKSDSLLTAGKN